MKIAVASMGDMVSQHFGKCENFNIFETDGKNIISAENFQSPGHDHGLLPVFLREKGVSVIISGGMGMGAKNGCMENGLQIITGAEGKAKDAVLLFLAGKLISKEVSCNHHHEGAEGGGHSCGGNCHNH